jgi:hypothetical protein
LLLPIIFMEQAEWPSRQDRASRFISPPQHRPDSGRTATGGHEKHDRNDLLLEWFQALGLTCFESFAMVFWLKRSFGDKK